MSKLVYYIDVESPETAWTLGELMSHVALPRKTLKMPKAKDLREQEELLILYAQGDCRLEVYKCGYFIYVNSKRHTVQSISRCASPLWYESSVPKEGKLIGIEHFLDKPFYIRLILEGEDRIMANQQSQEDKKTTSTDNIGMESSYLEDPNSNFFDKLLAEDDYQSNLVKLSTALDGLTERQRIAFIKYYAEEKTYQEIADELGCAKQTVHEDRLKRYESPLKKTNSVNRLL